MKSRKDHEERWLRQTKEFVTPATSKRQETLHRHLEQLLADHADERRMDRERETEKTVIDSQTNGHGTTQPSNQEMEVDRVDQQSPTVSSNPAFRLDPWSVNPQVETIVRRPVSLNDRRIYEDRFDTEEETAGPGQTLGLRWPTERQINRMMRRDGHQP